MCAIALAASPALSAMGPEEVFREYVWTGPFVNAGGWQRVTDPDANNAGAHAFLPNPVNEIVLDDLAGAVRAEAYIEMWGGHAGTSAKRLRLNGNDWLPIPEPAAIPGDAGTPGIDDPESYQAFTYPSVPLPLAQLREGANQFEFTSGPQISFNFNWGQWGIYGVTFRVYYGHDKPHATARIATPVAGDEIGDELLLSVAIDEGAPVERVDYFGLYEDFDFEGNGVYRQWHYTYRYGRIENHLGSAWAPSYAVTWNTEWVPDQDEPLAVMARIVDANGMHYTTPVVDGLALRREGRAVKLYKPFAVPGRWQTRVGRTDSAKLFVAEDLSRAVDARMILATWSGGHADAIGINGEKVVTRVGRTHDYSLDEIDVPLGLLRPGTNVAFTHAETEHHGIEVLWPGIALKVRYEGLADPEREPGADRTIFERELAADWQMRRAKGAHAEVGTDPEGRTALAAVAEEWGWAFELAPRVPLALDDFESIRLSFRPGDTDSTRFNWFRIGIGDARVALLDWSSDTSRVDLNDPGWQEIEIPLADFGLRDPYMESLHFSGAFTGAFYLDEVRLVAAPVTAVTGQVRGPRPELPRLLQSYPNPFNGATRVRFVLPVAGPAQLRVYNLVGQEVARLAEGWRESGLHEVLWEGLDAHERALASGVYLYRLRAAGAVQTRRLTLIR